MPVKPDGIIYGVDDKPGFLTSLVLGFQHYTIITISLIFPVLIVRSIGGAETVSDQLVSMSLLGAGIGVIYQAMRKGPCGSGYLIPQVCGPSFLPASFLAAKTGGLPLVFGMTILAGLSEMFFSRFLHKLRRLFPTEVTGLIVTMVGVSVIGLAAENFLAIKATNPEIREMDILVAVITLMTMVGINVWVKGKLRLFSVIIGMTVGYILCFSLGLINQEQLTHLEKQEYFAVAVFSHPGFDFDISLVIPFIIAMLCSSLKSIGDIITAQKINDANWKRPDMGNIRNGIFADGLGCMTGGVVGGLGQSTSSTNIGLSLATGATSRYIAYFVGAVCIGMSFMPKFSAFFSIMPRPVIGATLFFALSFMLIAGFQIITSRMMDSRKTFVIGLSIIFGITVDLMPQAFKFGLPPSIAPIFSNSLTASTVCAIILNLVTSVGIKKTAYLKIKAAASSFNEIKEMMIKNGKSWGARPEIIQKAIISMNELSLALNNSANENKDMMYTVKFDEFWLEIDADYHGDILEIPENINRKNITEEMLISEEIPMLLACRLADKITVKSKHDSHSVNLYFEH